MLHYQTIDPKTLGLLKKLQAIPSFSKLRLVGGTSLALQIGHRKSIDIDLFGEISADPLSIAKELDKVGNTTVLKKSENINIFTINNVKVDIVNYHYKWIENTLIRDGIIMAGKKDIAAMKLAAITGRGTKKDFIDLFFLLKEYNLKELLGFYNQKYHDGSLFLVIKSLSYFEDANEEENPYMLTEVDWQTVKQQVSKILTQYLIDNH